jgi:putative glycosyltransferase (TIGR04372 family)
MKQRIFELNHFHFILLAVLGRILYPLSVLIVSLTTLIFFFVAITFYPIIQLRIGNAYVSRVGHLSIRNWIYLLEQLSVPDKLNKRTVDVFFITQKISNEYILYNYKKIIPQLKRKYIKLGFLTFIISHSYLKFSEDPIWVFASKLSRKVKILRKFLVINSVEDEDAATLLNNKSAKNLLPQIWIKNLELPPYVPRNREIVAIFIRDSNYLISHLPNMYFEKSIILNSNTNIRNSTFEDYEYLIRLLINKGYFVIKMGVTSFPVAFRDPSFLDYAGLGYWNPKHDIEILSNCTFIVGTGSGLDTFPALAYGTPTWLFNVGEISKLQFSNVQDIRYFLSPKIPALNLSKLNGSRINEEENLLGLYEYFKKANSEDFTKYSYSEIANDLDFFLNCVLRQKRLITRSYLSKNYSFNQIRMRLEHRNPKSTVNSENECYTYFSPTFLNKISNFIV